MSSGLPGETAAAVVQAAGAMIQADGQNPRWDASKDNVAESAEIVTGFVRTFLLPLAALNRLGDWVRDKMEPALSEELRDVPPESIVPPLASVAGPALQGIGYSLEEDELRDMYVKLIASAMDGRVPGKAHPGYASIISSLSADETKYLPIVLGGTFPIAELRRGAPAGHFNVLQTNVLPVIDLTTGAFVVDSRIPQYIGNWIRLGLIEVDYMSSLSASDAYDWIEQHPQGSAYKTWLGDTFQAGHGILRATPFGTAFAAAVLPVGNTSQFGVCQPTPQAPEPASPEA